MIDVDFFKPINDKYGLIEGDRVLRIFADAAHRAVRRDDVPGRWGGEEFLLMLSAIPAARAQQCIDRMRESVAAAPLAEVSRDLCITFSAAVAIRGEVETLRATIDRCDGALYAAEAQGRNC